MIEKSKYKDDIANMYLYDYPKRSFEAARDLILNKIYKEIKLSTNLTEMAKILKVKHEERIDFLKYFINASKDTLKYNMNR